MTCVEFGNRLAYIRIRKGVSARTLSLRLGLSASYINNIENGKNFPTMQIFFKICKELKIAPKDFFDVDLPDPILYNQLLGTIKTFNSTQLQIFMSLAEQIASRSDC